MLNVYRDNKTPREKRYFVHRLFYFRQNIHSEQRISRWNTHMSKSLPGKSLLKIDPWNDFRERGINLAAWAREKGFNQQLVYLVIRGERKCLRGQSHSIAKELGMK